MILLALLVAAMLLAAYIARGADVSFEWNPSPDSSVVGYRLYIGTNATFVRSNAIAVVISPTTNATWNAAQLSVDYWAFCTAANTNMESEPSNVTQFRPIPPPFTLRVKMALMQSSGVNGPWEPVNAPCWEFDVPQPTNQAFYRGMVQIER